MGPILSLETRYANTAKISILVPWVSLAYTQLRPLVIFFAVQDPHADLVDETLETIPRHRTSDVI